MAGSNVLIVNDEKNILESLKSILGVDGCVPFEAYTTEQAIRVLDTENIDLVISDVNINGTSGLGLLSYVNNAEFGSDVILLSTSTDTDLANKAVQNGVYDFIYKPFHAFDLLLSVRRALEKRKLSLRSRELQMNMEKKIKEQTLSLHLRNQEKQQLLISTIRSLVSALEAKDKYTEGHSRRVAANAVAMAQMMGFSAADCEEISLAGLFHDIGKIGITEAVLNKKGQLTAEEYELIKTHPLISQKIVEQIPQFKRISRIVRHHHEFFDGSGYPDNISGTKIPIGSRIMTVCDAYDAMTSDRSYRTALEETRALYIIKRNAGTQFDPDIVEVFLRMKGFHG